MATDFKHFLCILYTCEMKDCDNLMNGVAQLAADGTAYEKKMRFVHLYCLIKDTVNPRKFEHRFFEILANSK